MLEAQKATDLTALALGRLVGEKPSARYSRLEKRKPVLPAVHEMNERTCSHQENHMLRSQCEAEG